MEQEQRPLMLTGDAFKKIIRCKNRKRLIASARSYAEADELLVLLPVLKEYFTLNDCTTLLNEISQNNQYTDNGNYNQIREKIMP